MGGGRPGDKVTVGPLMSELESRSQIRVPNGVEKVTLDAHMSKSLGHVVTRWLLRIKNRHYLQNPCANCVDVTSSPGSLLPPEMLFPVGGGSLRTRLALMKSDTGRSIP